MKQSFGEIWQLTLCTWVQALQVGMQAVRPHFHQRSQKALWLPLAGETDRWPASSEKPRIKMQWSMPGLLKGINWKMGIAGVFFSSFGGTNLVGVSMSKNYKSNSDHSYRYSTCKTECWHVVLPSCYWTLEAWVSHCNPPSLQLNHLVLNVPEAALKVILENIAVMVLPLPLPPKQGTTHQTGRPVPCKCSHWTLLKLPVGKKQLPERLLQLLARYLVRSTKTSQSKHQVNSQNKASWKKHHHPSTRVS